MVKLPVKKKLNAFEGGLKRFEDGLSVQDTTCAVCRHAQKASDKNGK